MLDIQYSSNKKKGTEMTRKGGGERERERERERECNGSILTNKFGCVLFNELLRLTKSSSFDHWPNNEGKHLTNLWTMGGKEGLPVCIIFGILPERMTSASPSHSALEWGGRREGSEPSLVRHMT